MRLTKEEFNAKEEVKNQCWSTRRRRWFQISPKRVLDARNLWSKDRKWVKREVKEVFTDGKLRNNWESEESRKEGKVDVEGSWERGIEEER